MKRTSKVESVGAKGFDKNYWESNYGEGTLDQMDGIGNVKEHAMYIKYVFGIEYIDINSVIDFGFGLGHLFKEVLKVFVPYQAVGIEPSSYAFNQVSKEDVRPVPSTKLQLNKTDILSWCRKNNKLVRPKRFDLGICTSVLQYLSNEELEEVIPMLSNVVKYLYLSVPTDKELDRQISEISYFDKYAIRRSKSFYQNILKKNFTFVSGRLLESKIHFDEQSTDFTDLLFRF